MQPRVLFLDHASVLGGAELYLLDIVRHHRKTSRVVLFEQGPFYNRLRAERIDVQVLDAPSILLDVQKKSSGWQHLRALPSMIRLAGCAARIARRYDVVFANSQKALAIGALAGFIARRPVIWNLHDMLTAEHFSAFNRRLAVLLANGLVNRIIVNSQATKRAFAASGGHVKKTAVVYNGIDSGGFSPLSERVTRGLREQVGLPEDAPVIGVFSRLAHWKGQHVLIKALKDIPEAHVLLVGAALFNGDASYAEGLRHQAQQLGLADRVHFVGFRQDVSRWMQIVDVVVHSSIAPEPFGRVIVEGMLAERPVVAAQAGGALEIIEHGKTGLLVPPNRPKALAETLNQLLAEPSLRHALARTGRQQARKRFSKERMLAAITAHVQQMIAEKRNPSS